MHLLQKLVAGCSSEYKDLLIWCCNIPPKVQIFAWQLCHDSLATGSNYLKHQFSVGGRCPRCPLVIEDDHHLFFFCSFTRRIWNVEMCRRVWNVDMCLDKRYWFKLIVKCCLNNFILRLRIYLCRAVLRNSCKFSLHHFRIFWCDFVQGG